MIEFYKLYQTFEFSAFDPFAPYEGVRLQNDHNIFMKSKYSKKRPKIPTEIRRLVAIESGHNCAINGCNEHTYNEYHHIDGNRENNKQENLIFLCDKHHKMAHAGAIDRKSLKEYKKINQSEGLRESVTNGRGLVELNKKLSEIYECVKNNNCKKTKVIDNEKLNISVGIIIPKSFNICFLSNLKELGFSHEKSTSWTSYNYLSNLIYTEILVTLVKNDNRNYDSILLKISSNIVFIFDCFSEFLFQDKNLKHIPQLIEFYKGKYPDILEDDSEKMKTEKMKEFVKLSNEKEEGIKLVLDYFERIFTKLSNMIYSNMFSLFEQCKRVEERVLLSRLLQSEVFVNYLLFNDTSLKYHYTVGNICLNYAFVTEETKIAFLITSNEYSGNLLNLGWSVHSINPENIYEDTQTAIKEAEIFV